MSRKVLPARITADWLRKRGACESSVAWFMRKFPNGVARITASVVASAMRSKHGDLHWLVYESVGGVARASSCPVCDGDVPRKDAKAIAKFLRDHQRSSAEAKKEKERR